MRRHAPAAMLLVLIGCADAPTAPPEPPAPPASGAWVNPFDWAVADPSVDPFGDARPDGTACDPEAHGPEELGGFWVYSIETGPCPWITLSQPTALPAGVGDHIQASVWHFALTAPSPATAHVRFATEDAILMEAEVAIPTEGALLTLDHTLTDPLPTGTLLHFHLDNHGANSWHLVGVNINPE